MWVLWEKQDRVFAARTNAAATKVGAVRSVGKPGSSSSLYNIAGEGGTGKLDVVVNDSNFFWHTQVLPGLTLKAKPVKWDGDFAKTVAFTVKDAGSSVGNAKVKVGSRACTTGGTGKCSIHFPGGLPAGKLTATSAHAGYAKASIKLKVLA